MADETILQQDVLTAVSIANPAEWYFGVERLGFITPHRISLADIGVALVDPVDADITALDARLDAAEAQLLTLVNVTGDILALDGRVTINEGAITTLQGDLALVDARVGVNEANIILLDGRVITLEATLQSKVADNVAALALETPLDGDLWQTKGYTTVGDGGDNLYRYDAASVAAVDGGLVLQGPGGIGRYLALDRFTIKPEHFGADPRGLIDSTAAMQAWANALATVAQGHALAEGIYLVTDTITFPQLMGIALTIGNGEFLTQNYQLVNHNAFSGIRYAGPAGAGPQPENCKPAIWIKTMNACTINTLAVCQALDAAATFTTGILISNGDSNQRGNSRIGTLFAGSFYRGFVIGLHDHPGGLIGHAATGYSDDCFESNTVERMIASGCASAVFFGCQSTNETHISYMAANGYLPNERTADLGLADCQMDLQTVGNLQIDNIGVYQTRMGVSKQLVGSVDPATDRITIAGHGFSDGDTVYIYASTGAQLPGGLATNDTWYFIVGSDLNTFQLSTTSGGTAVAISTSGSGNLWIVETNGSETCVRLGEGNIVVSKCYLETWHAMAWNDTGTTVDRHPTVVGSLICNYGVKNHAQTCVQVKRAYKFTDAVFAGNVIYRSSLDVWSPTFLQDATTGLPYKFLQEGAFTPPVPIVMNAHWKNAFTNVWSETSYSVLPQTMYRSHHGTWQEYQPTRLQMVDRSGTVTAVDDVADTITFGGTFATGDRVILRTAGTLPGGTASLDGVTTRRYFLVNYVAGVAQLAETAGGTPINITSAGGSNTIHRVYDIWKYSLLTTKGYAQAIRTWLTFAGNESATHALSGSVELEALIASTTAAPPVVAIRETVTLAEVMLGYTTFDVYPTLSIDTVGSMYVVTFSLGQDNSANFGLGMMSGVQLFSQASNLVNSQPIDIMGYPGRQGGRFDWILA